MESTKIAQVEQQLEQPKTLENLNFQFGNLPRYAALAKYAKNLEKLSKEIVVKQPHKYQARFDKLSKIKVANLKVELKQTRERIGKIDLTKEDRTAIVCELLEALVEASMEIIEEAPKSSLSVVFAEIKSLFGAWKDIKSTGKASEESIRKIDELFAQTLRVCTIAHEYMAQYAEAKQPTEQVDILKKINTLTKDIKKGYDKCKKAIDNIDYISLMRKVQITKIRENQSEILNRERADVTFTVECIFEPFKILAPASFKLLAWANTKLFQRAVTEEAKMMPLKEAIQAKEDELEAYLKEIEATRVKAVQLVKENSL